MPPRVAHVEQRRPSSAPVRADVLRRVPGERRPHLRHLAQDRGHVEIPAGDLRVALEEPHRAPGLPIDAGREEGVDELLRAHGAGLDLGLQDRPAGKAVLARDHELRGGQRDRDPRALMQVRPDALFGDLVRGSHSVPELLGLAAELVEVRAFGQRAYRHVVSSAHPPGPLPEAKEIDIVTRGRVAEVDCCPRARVRPRRAAR